MEVATDTARSRDATGDVDGDGHRCSYSRDANGDELVTQVQVDLPVQ